MPSCASRARIAQARRRGTAFGGEARRHVSIGKGWQKSLNNGVSSENHPPLADEEDMHGAIF